VAEENLLNAEFIERYQLEYAKNPKSKVFAPLSEGYRRLGLLKEALEVAHNGVAQHPQFASGRVAYARILIEFQKKEDAVVQLRKAVELSPDNWLAHSLLGDLYLQLRKPKEALKSFKMVLFLHPQDEKAKKAVQKWEFLTADEYDDELFEMKPLFTPNSTGNQADKSAYVRKEIDRALSLADAFTVRSELEQAIQVLKDAQSRLGSQTELEERLVLLSRRQQKQSPPADPGASSKSNHRKQKLEQLLRRIEARKSPIS
jgi:tetratricopeptide (TPR) repeat protein